MDKAKTNSKPFSPAGLDRLRYNGAIVEKSEPSGLRIVVGKRSKSFVYRYHSPKTDKPRKLNLGRYPQTSLADARTKVVEAKELLGQKIDPADIILGARQALADSPTVKEVAEDYLARVASRKRSGGEDRRYVEKELVPVLGNYRIAMVERRQIVAMVDDLAERAPTSSRNLLIYTRLVFQHALERGLIDHNPCSDIRSKFTANARQRVLTDAEIREFWSGVEALEIAPAIKGVLKLCLVTGQRHGEVRQMKWTDLDGDWWTIPAEISKNKLAHRVPLTPSALAIIETAREKRGDNPFVFAGKEAEKPLGRSSANQALRRGTDTLELEDFTIHDLRRTAASNMAAIGVPHLVIGQVLNHAERGVTAVYDRHSYDPEKRIALSKWDARLNEILGNTPKRKGPTDEEVFADFVETVENAPAYASAEKARPRTIAVTLDADQWSRIVNHIRTYHPEIGKAKRKAKGD